MGHRLLSYGVAIVAVAAAAFAGCSGDSNPLGGPYGGTASLPPPTTQAASGDDGGGGSGSSSSSSSGSTTSSSGSGSASSSSGSSSGTSTSSSGTTSTSGGSSSGVHVSSSGGSSSGFPPSSSSGSSTSSSSGGSTSSSSSGGTGAPVTFSYLYKTYLVSGSIGNCVGCHNGTGSSSSMYTWLGGQRQSPQTLASKTGSCLSWFGGNMPPFGPQSAQAVTDFTAWAAAGGMNN